VGLSQAKRLILLADATDLAEEQGEEPPVSELASRK
jgi:hypothetical protein